MCGDGLNDAEPMSSYDDGETDAGSRLVGVEGEGYLPPHQIGVRSEAYDTMAGFH